MMRKRRIGSAYAVLLLMSGMANAAAKNESVQITILQSETHSTSRGDNGVPKNCDAVNFDAYCHNSKTVQVNHTMLVREDDKPPFRIDCSVDMKWSRCVPLPVGQTFEAKREKRGLTVYYTDDQGKVRKQLYTLVDKDLESTPADTGRPSSTPTLAKQDPSPLSSGTELVKCRFTSTPSQAEITVDGKFAGSTPSVVALSAGNHTVEISIPEFATWKKDLTISQGSELTVNALLQKTQ